MQPGVRNHTLKELNLFCCGIGDEGVHALTDALLGKTTMEALNIDRKVVAPRYHAADRFDAAPND